MTESRGAPSRSAVWSGVTVTSISALAPGRMSMRSSQPIKNAPEFSRPMRRIWSFVMPSAISADTNIL